MKTKVDVYTGTKQRAWCDPDYAHVHMDTKGRMNRDRGALHVTDWRVCADSNRLFKKKKFFLFCCYVTNKAIIDNQIFMSPTTFTMKTDSIINLTNKAIIDKFYGARKERALH